MNQRAESDRSCYLEDIENDALVQFIEEQNGVSLATTITEVWKTPKEIAWAKVDTGVLCFVKDYTKRSYFFRLYSLDFCLVSKKPDQIWEHQLYLPFAYNQVTPYFHFFEQDDNFVGLNFSFDDEADKFMKIIGEKVLDRSKRFYENQQSETCPRLAEPAEPINRLPRSVSLKCDSYRPHDHQLDFRKTTPNSLKNKLSSVKTNGANYFSMFKSKMAKSFNKKQPIGKHEISAPRNPRHVQHIGVANNRLEVNLAMQDESTRKMQEILQDLRLNIPVTRRTREFIDSFVQEHGGYEQFDDAIKKQKKLRPKASIKVYPSPNEKARAPVLKPPKPNAPPPPLPTAKSALRPSPTSPELSRILSPPASPKSFNATRINFNDSNQQLEQAQSNAPAPLNSTSISRCPVALSPPPPVPPPLPPNFSKIQVSSSDELKSSSPDSSGENSSSNGTTTTTTTKQPFISVISLSPPASSDNSGSSSTSSANPDNRQDLLSSIKNFQGFKSKLQTPELRTPVTSPATDSANVKPSLIDQLRMELLKRAQYLNSGSDDEDQNGDEEQSDSEWC